MIARFRYLAPPAMLGALVSNLLTAIIITPGWSQLLLLFNVAMYCASILITLLGNVPLNRQFMEWQPKALPGNWMELIRRWAVYDQIRFALCLLGFLFALIATGLTRLH